MTKSVFLSNKKHIKSDFIEKNSRKKKKTLEFYPKLQGKKGGFPGFFPRVFVLNAIAVCVAQEWYWRGPWNHGPDDLQRFDLPFSHGGEEGAPSGLRFGWLAGEVAGF